MKVLSDFLIEVSDPFLDLGGFEIKIYYFSKDGGETFLDQGDFLAFVVHFLNISGALFEYIGTAFKIELNFLVSMHFKDSDFFENMILFLIKIAVTKDQVTTLTLRKKIKLTITTTLFLDQVIFYFWANF